MKSEKEKMLAGELYNGFDADLLAERQSCRLLCKEFNNSDPATLEERKNILEKLFGKSTNAIIEPPFFCDYGYNIKLGNNVFLNFLI